MMDIKERLGLNKYDIDKEYAHITINEEICEKCPHHFCVLACPANCYNLINGKIVFNYEDCVECGTCSVACDRGSVSWHYPKSNHGIIYKYG